MNSNLPTPTGLLAKASSLLTDAGYVIATAKAPEWSTQTSRVFEDRYNVVGLVVFPTCNELLSSWLKLQESLVQLISRHVMATEGKAWDGYLVLLTPATAPSERLKVDSIRHDTARLRKLVATGEELESDSEVERVLRPLLPMYPVNGVVEADSILSLLPSLLAEHGISTNVTDELVTSFRARTPLMEGIHRAERPQ
jgi:hypothetical protein